MMYLWIWIHPVSPRADIHIIVVASGIEAARAAALLNTDGNVEDIKKALQRSPIVQPFPCALFYAPTASGKPPDGR